MFEEIIRAATIMAAPGTIEKFESIGSAHSNMLGMNIPVSSLFYCKDCFTSHPMQWVLVDRSISGDVPETEYEHTSNFG